MLGGGTELYVHVHEKEESMLMMRTVIHQDPSLHHGGFHSLREAGLAGGGGGMGSGGGGRR